MWEDVREFKRICDVRAYKRIYENVRECIMWENVREYKRIYDVRGCNIM